MNVAFYSGKHGGRFKEVIKLNVTKQFYKPGDFDLRCTASNRKRNNVRISISMALPTTIDLIVGMNSQQYPSTGITNFYFNEYKVLS